MNNIVVIGTGGVGRGTQQIIEDINRCSPEYKFVGYLDEDKVKHQNIIGGHPVLGGLEWLNNKNNHLVAIGINNPRSRKKVVKKLRGIGHKKFATLVHPQAWIANKVEVGEGSIIYAGVCINTGSRIGDFSIINMNATVGHDVMMKDYVSIAPGVNISGSVGVGEGCNIGTGSAVIQNLKLGDYSIIGAGAVVIKDIPPNVIAFGVPAEFDFNQK